MSTESTEYNRCQYANWSNTKPKYQQELRFLTCKLQEKKDGNGYAPCPENGNRLTCILYNIFVNTNQSDVPQSSDE